MAKNLEIKVKTDSNGEAEKILELRGIKTEKTLIQRDVYFNVPGSLLKLRNEKEGRSRLIKYNRHEGEGLRWSDYEILFVEGEEPEKFLSAFLDVNAAVEKTRRLYIYKNVRIHLDEVTGLGSFIELESVVGKNSEAEAELNFEEVKNFMNLEKYEELRCSYYDLKVNPG